MARRLRVIGIAASALAALALLGAWAWPRLIPLGRLEQARAAYDRHDWQGAAALAREALRERPDDVDALRLLARSYGRSQSDEKAQELYGRLGDKAMQAEDYFLLGAGLLRQGAAEPAVAVLEKARSLDPDHAETLHELARLYARLNRIGDAVEAAARLPHIHGWESRGNVVVGLLREERGDPVGASEALDRALRADPQLRGAAAAPGAVRKLLARTLLQTRQPARARTHLENVLASGADAEASWLLSRTFLQERNAPKAAEALASAGDYGKDDPLRHEPAPYVGAKACAGCHAAIHRSEQNSRHARTLYQSNELADVILPKGPVPDPVAPGVSHTFRREGGTIRLETRADDKVRRAVIEYALGSGNHGMTMIGRDEAGRARVLRVSSFDHQTLWDLTTNAPPPEPDDPDSVVGRYLPADALQKCLDCHLTSFRAARDRTVPEAADRGIGCERCHGPGGNHLAAAASDFDDLAIARPGLASALQITRLCGVCHGSDDPSIEESDPLFIRFQALTLPMSRCYTESGGGLSCLTCHNPHGDAAATPTYYEAQCLSCHAVSPPKPSRATRHAVLAEGSRRAPCPVNPVKDCLQCHMPATKSAPHHADFADHHIRVHRPSSQVK